LSSFSSLCFEGDDQKRSSTFWGKKSAPLEKILATPMYGHPIWYQQSPTLISYHAPACVISPNSLHGHVTQAANNVKKTPLSLLRLTPDRLYLEVLLSVCFRQLMHITKIEVVTLYQDRNVPVWGNIIMIIIAIVIISHHHYHYQHLDTCASTVQLI